MKITRKGLYIIYRLGKCGGDLEEANSVLTVQKKPVKKRKIKSWGDDGFVGRVQFGCFDYDVRFVPEEKIKQEIGQSDDMNVFGAINQFDQIIYIASDSSLQTQKATLMHELIHAVFLLNGTSCVGDEKTLSDELLVDRTSNGIYEIMRRNPEIIRWITK